MKKFSKILFLTAFLMAFCSIPVFTSDAAQTTEKVETTEVEADETTEAGAEAESFSASGSYNDDLSWTLSDDGVLTISGTGEIPAASGVFDSDTIKSIKSVIINPGVTSIGNSAFSGCTSLTSVEIPDSVTSIGSDAFYRCTSLKSVTIPEGVTSIGGAAFELCSNLASLNIPEDVTIIGSFTFCGCTSLTSVDIPEGVTSIGDCAFADCSGLTSVNIPEGVTHIGYYAFENCTSLTSIVIPASVDGGLSYNIFCNCTALKSAIIMEGVTKLGNGLFFQCTGLTSVTLPDSLTYIGNAFEGCTGLTSLEIPDSVTDLGFPGCTNLVSFNIPDSLTEIGIHAFKDCTNLSMIQLPDTLNFKVYTTVQTGWSAEKVYSPATLSIFPNEKSITYRVYNNTETLAYLKANGYKYYIIDAPVEEVFTDVKGESWYNDAVQFVYENGIMTGTSSSTFTPSAKISRAEFATILYRLEGSPEVVYTGKFPDVSETAWYMKAVTWSNNSGIVSGYNSGYFGPNDKITREQMAVMMYRYAKMKGYDISKTKDFSSFTDAAKVSSFAKDAMKWAVGTEIITGKDNGTKLDPSGQATRAEAATIIMRFMKLYEQ